MIFTLQAILSGIFFTLIYDFFIFLAIWNHYIKSQEIEEFFNPFFWDHQNIVVLFVSLLFFSIIVAFVKKPFLSFIIGPLLLLSIVVNIYQPFGFLLGELVLKQDYTSFKDSRYTYHGYIIYEGRQEIYFHDTDVNQTFQLNKKDLSL